MSGQTVTACTDRGNGQGIFETRSSIFPPTILIPPPAG